MSEYVSPITNEDKVVKRVVKGWAIVNLKPIAPEPKIRISKNDPPLSTPCIWGESGGWGAMQIFTNKNEAIREFEKEMHKDEISRPHADHAIIPCEIRYTLHSNASKPQNKTGESSPPPLK
jgi:hypothetical protein